jgi:hypothetical protein
VLGKDMTDLDGKERSAYLGKGWYRNPLSPHQVIMFVPGGREKQ